MIKVIIFDWDGVIVDSMPFIAQGIQETALTYGVEISIEAILDGYFQPRDAYYRSLGIDTSDQVELNRRHSASIKKYQKSVPIFPEAADVLRFIKQNNFKLGIASTASTSFITEELSRFNLADIFSLDLIWGGETAKEQKLKNFLEVLKVSPEEMMYVGDLPSDILAARANNIRAAGIERREIARKRLAALNPDYLFSSLHELETLLKPNL